MRDLQNPRFRPGSAGLSGAYEIFSIGATMKAFGVRQYKKKAALRLQSCRSRGGADDVLVRIKPRR